MRLFSNHYDAQPIQSRHRQQSLQLTTSETKSYDANKPLLSRPVLGHPSAHLSTWSRDNQPPPTFSSCQVSYTHVCCPWSPLTPSGATWVQL